VSDSRLGKHRVIAESTTDNNFSGQIRHMTVVLSSPPLLHPPSKLDLSSRPGICTIFYHDDEQRNISNGTRTTA
jgi:hypothetical protein